jgi:hypothetical protein
LKKAFIVVSVITLLATVLFILNRGFGGGHGTYDSALGILALPWILLPLPGFLFKYDFVWLVLTPFILNFLAVLVLGRLVLRQLGRKPLKP